MSSELIEGYEWGTYVALDTFLSGGTCPLPSWPEELRKRSFEARPRKAQPRRPELPAGRAFQASASAEGPPVGCFEVLVLEGLGGFGALSPRRDSPFRDSRAEVKAPEPKTVEVKPAAESRSVYGMPVVEPAKPAEIKRAEPSPKTAPAKPVPSPTVREPSRLRQKQPQRKADIYSERVTLQISAEMRDEVDELARQLQRAKTSKDERITANTVMRVAIRLLTENFKLKAGEGPNNEEELFELAERLLREERR